MTTAIGYVRQSKTADTDASPESQRRAIQAHATTQGWDLVEVFDDVGISGWNPNVDRPGFNAAMERATNGDVDVLIVRDLSRLSRKGLRDVLDIIDTLDENEVKMVSVAEPHLDPSTPIGAAILGLFAALAKQESDLRSEKIREAKDTLREGGRTWDGGTPPFGLTLSDDGEHLVLHETNAEHLQWMVSTYIAGGSIRSIAVQLNERGIPSVRGGKWSTAAINNLFRNPRLCGGRRSPMTTVDRKKVLGDVINGDDGLPEVFGPQVVDVTTWLQLQAVMDGNSFRRGPQNITLLSGITRCGRCGGRLGGHDTSKPSAVYRCAAAIRGEGCSGVSINIAGTDRVILGAVASFLNRLDPDDEDTWPRLEAVARRWGRASGELAVRERLEVERDTLVASLDRLDDDRSSGAFDGAGGQDRYLRQVQTISAKLGAVEVELKSAPSVDPSFLLDLAGVADDPDDPISVLEDLPMEKRREVVRAVVERIDVAPGGKAGVFDPSRLSVSFVGVS